MPDLGEQLQTADEHIQAADDQLRAAAEEVRGLLNEDDVSPDYFVKSGLGKIGVEVEINYRETVARLNNEIEYPHAALQKDSSIIIVDINEIVDIGPPDPVDHKIALEQNVKMIVEALEDVGEGGAPEEMVIKRVESYDLDRSKGLKALDRLKKKGEIYEPADGRLRTT